MSSEHLHFKIGLSGTYWNKTPAWQVQLDDQIQATGQVSVATDEVFYVEFDADIAEDASHVLKVSLTNKDNSDVVKAADDVTITQDMLLNIVSVDIDDISLGSLIWTHSEFVGDDPDRPVLTNCVTLGWNGTWSLKFDSPFYIWLLSNL
jgi:hypothetical protein